MDIFPIINIGQRALKSKQAVIIFLLVSRIYIYSSNFISSYKKKKKKKIDTKLSIEIVFDRDGKNFPGIRQLYMCKYTKKNFNWWNAYYACSFSREFLFCNESNKSDTSMRLCDFYIWKIFFSEPMYSNVQIDIGIRVNQILTFV